MTTAADAAAPACELKQVGDRSGWCVVVRAQGPVIVRHNPHQHIYWWECTTGHPGEAGTRRGRVHHDTPEVAERGMWRHLREAHRETFDAALGPVHCDSCDASTPREKMVHGSIGGAEASVCYDCAEDYRADLGLNRLGYA